MAINLKFDLMGNPEPPSIVLANRNGNKLGQLNVNIESIDVSDKFNAASEFSFTLNKYIDDKPTPLWDKVVDFKLVYCPEWDIWFEIKVELDEATETVKTVFCTQLGQAELSQIMLYNVEINTDIDIEREDYKTSILYDKDNPKSSILHRLLEKAPHYSIAYVDDSIQRIQRQFSFDGTSICDAFNEIGEEIGCLFIYNSNSQAGGKPNRTISVYDLQQNCNNKDCKHRGEFTDKCPKCESIDITYGYGEDTTIFVTSDELATEGIQLVTDTDAVKNCFKLEAGDDLMTATIRNCNPNGTDYIWYFSDSMKEDMSKELVNRIESYDELYKEHYNGHTSKLNETFVNKYNALVGKYKGYYDTPSTCLDCKTESDFKEQCSNCNSKNILTGQKLQTIPTEIIGYPALMTAYYNTIDLLLYLESGLMPNVEMSDTKAEDQIELLTTTSLSPVAVNVKEIKNASLTTANSAVLSMAKVLIRPTYKVDIVDGSYSLNETIYSDDNGEYRVWTGKFVVTNYSDEKDTATSDVVSVRINNATETFIKQKIEKSLNKENTDDYSITGLFAKDYDDFCAELKKYALNPLDDFSKSCESCLSILTEQGAGDNEEKSDLYEKLYKPYFDKQQAINNEIKIRQDEIAVIEGVWDKSDENNPKCVTKGLQQYIEGCQKEIQELLDFEGYLGKNLWLEFCSYRREDKYSNSNYISDGLNNAELFKKANEFIGVAEEEIFKSAELQHSISATLNNLLALPKFKPLIKYFKTGNWIRVQIDERVYKLRLLEYDISFGDFNTISVEFSDVAKIKNGITDVQDVFSQASSMASSYDSVQRQAQKGNVARTTIDQWLIDGLNAANVQIQSNNSEEVLLTKNGLLARSYDDITGAYSPEQLKITHNIMAYTDDNWGTVKQAIGKHSYKFFDKETNNFIDEIGYGVTAEFIDAGHVSGSQIIGGDIYSDNYSTTDRTGSYLNLRDGTFSFGGGALRFDGKDLLISSPNVLTKNEITTINEEYLKTTSVYAEKLQVNAAHIKEKLTASQIDADGIEANNVNITGVINAQKGGTIAGFTINDNSIYHTKNSFDDVLSDGVYIGTDGISLGMGKFRVDNEGRLYSKRGIIGGFTIDDTNIYHTKISYDDTTNNGVYLGTDGIGLGKGKFYVTYEGFLHAESGEFSGTINGGSININEKFKVDTDGNVTLAGDIIWDTNSIPSPTLDHESVFNALTCDGVLQGIFEENGELYVNGSYIKSGMISSTNLETDDYGNVTSGMYINLNNGNIYTKDIKIVGDGIVKINGVLRSEGTNGTIRLQQGKIYLDNPNGGRLMEVVYNGTTYEVCLAIDPTTHATSVKVVEKGF